MVQKIENLLGADSFKIFIEGFRFYKTDAKAIIDGFAISLFKAFFGDENPVCHLEVSNYVLRKQTIIQFEDEVHFRHRDRYTSIINDYF